MIGLPAPDFSLKGSDGNLHSLKDLPGRNIVLVFYVINNTPG